MELSFLFADVRGSTGLAESLPAPEFSAPMARFYGAAAQVVDRWDGGRAESVEATVLRS